MKISSQLENLAVELTANNAESLQFMNSISRIEPTKNSMMKLTEKNKQEIRKLLSTSPDFVIEGGLERLIKLWKHFVVDECEIEGYSLPIEDYINDLDGRMIIQYIIDNISDKEISKSIALEIKEYDDRFKKLLVDTDKCIRGEQTGLKRKLIKKFLGMKSYNKQKHFWYYGIIKTAKGTLLENARREDFNI